MFKTRKRRIKEECWNLDYELVKWLNEHLAVYLEDARGTIDLSYFKYKYKGKEYTLEECIEMLIEDTYYILNEEDNLKELNYKKNEMYDILKLIHWQLWW